MEKQLKGKVLVAKLIFACILIVIFSIFAIKLFPLMMDLSTQDGQFAFKEKVNEMGFKGMLLLFGLQLAQIVLVVLPGEPLEVLTGMCYGTWGGLLFSFVSVFITTSLIYLATYKFGKDLIHYFFKKERTDKIEKSTLFKNQKKIEILMIILFLIPGTPKDLLTYTGVLLPIKPLRFILIATFARFPSIISSTYAGATLSVGNWEKSIIIYIVTFATTGVFIFFVNKKNKKDSEELIEVLK